ncbi:MAG: DUF6731 family protein [Burkholderiaceae bacterium]
MKRFGVRFYVGNAEAAAEGEPTISQLLIAEHQRQAEGQQPTQLEQDRQRYELRDLRLTQNGQVLLGVLAVLRDDAPNIREANGGERRIELGDDEGVIEKNHFLFRCSRSLLIWQVNGRASHISRMERFVTGLTGARFTVTFDDVLDRNAIARLHDGVVRRLKVRLAAPQNAQAYDADDWSDDVLRVLQGAGATTISVEVGIRRRGQGLRDTVKAAIHDFLNRAETRAIDVKLLGEENFIDLMADRVQDSIQVQMVGLYPDETSIFAELERAYDRRRPQLDAFFGVGDGTLD